MIIHSSARELFLTMQLSMSVAADLVLLASGTAFGMSASSSSSAAQAGASSAPKASPTETLRSKTDAARSVSTHAHGPLIH